MAEQLHAEDPRLMTASRTSMLEVVLARDQTIFRSVNACKMYGELAPFTSPRTAAER